MSIKLMNLVWENGPDNSTQRFVLLTLADMANDNGLSVYPSMAHVARKCALERRSVIRAINALVEDGFLRRTRRWKGDEPTSNEYEIALSRIGARPVDDDIPMTTRRSDRQSLPSDTQSLRIVNMTLPDDRESLGSVVDVTTPSDRMSHDPSFLTTNEPPINRGMETRYRAPQPAMTTNLHPAIKAMYQVTTYWPGEIAHPVIIEKIGDSPNIKALERAYQLWISRGYNPKNFDGIGEWYKELSRDITWMPPAQHKGGGASAQAQQPTVSRSEKAALEYAAQKRAILGGAS